MGWGVSRIGSKYRVINAMVCGGCSSQYICSRPLSRFPRASWIAMRITGNLLDVLLL